MNLDNVTSTSINDPCKIKHPKPTDFDHFLPWACRALSIDIDVVVTRATQNSYASVIAKNKKINYKQKRQPSLVSTADDVILSSVFDTPAIAKAEIIIIETIYDINENLVQLKLLKNKVIPRKVMQTIALTLPYQPHLTSITINGGLRMDTLYEISKFLPNSYIAELCLDGTFLSQANYYTLLTNSKLKHLSLAKCTINDTVIETIADQLKEPCPAARILSALNLSNNRITDDGAKYLADMLRTNRQLSYLNLAGNMITDEGGMSILDTLHEFPLHAQELFESRTRYVAYLKQKNDLIKTFIIELQTAFFDKSYKKKSKKGKRDSVRTQSLQFMSLQKPLIDSGADAQTIQEQAERLAKKRLGSFTEPFSPKNTRTEDGVVHCFGNNTLCYLNIAYNNLTYASLKKLHQIISTQKCLNRTPRGLIKVVIEGNLMPVACKEYEKIDKLFGSGVGDIRRQFESGMKRRPGITKSTATSIGK